MNDEDDWDDQLVARFAEDDLPDGGFSAAIVERLERHRRRRRIVASRLLTAALMAIAATSFWMPVPALPSGAVTPLHVAAALVLVTACSLILIATEPSIDLRQLP